MNKRLKKKLLNKYKPRNIKWLFGGAMPMYYLYIYEGLPDNFILWYETEELCGKSWNDTTSLWDLKEITHVERMIGLWKRRVEWIGKFSNLVRKPFEKKDHITPCVVETKQEYADFKRADILDVIKYFGLAAQLLYCAERDVFNSCPILNPGKYEPLNKYYLASHKYLTWLVATFWQGETIFVDFHALLERELK